MFFLTGCKRTLSSAKELLAVARCMNDLITEESCKLSEVVKRNKVVVVISSAEYFVLSFVSNRFCSVILFVGVL